jgi:hypothetical protein
MSYTEGFAMIDEIQANIPLPPPIPQSFNNIPKKTEKSLSPLYSEWDLQELEIHTEEWVKKASTYGMDIREKLHNIQLVINQAPELKDPENGQIREVTLIQQLKVRGMYLNGIIHQIAKQMIDDRVQQALKIPAIKDNTQLYSLVLQSEKYLKKLLPPDRTLISPHIIREKYIVLMDELDRISEKILTLASRTGKLATSVMVA